jgi:hypothetical protein
MRSRDFRKILHLACAAIVVAAVLVFGASPPAHASTFTFTGTCTAGVAGNCTGTATATLVLTGYTEGSTIVNGNFVSFTYNSDLPLSLSYSGAPTEPSLPPPGQIYSITGDLQNLPGPAFVEITLGPLATEVVFESQALGAAPWCAGTGGTGCGATDIGSPSSWSVTPLPPTALLFATGLAGLGLLGWRRKRKAAA